MGMNSNIQPSMNIQLSVYEPFKISGGLMTSEKHLLLKKKNKKNSLNMKSVNFRVAYELKCIRVQSGLWVYQMHPFASNRENEPKT